MKNVSLVVAAVASLAFSSLAAAQSSSTPPVAPKSESMHHESGWKELDAFHALLAATWHPIEKGDFKPVREKAAALAEAATAWAASTPPAKCDAQGRAAAKAIAPQVRVLATQIAAGAADSTVRSRLEAVHDRFEAAEHACMDHHQ